MKTKTEIATSTNFQTHLSRRYIEQTLTLADRLQNDPEKARRLSEQECKVCYYRSQVAGQAFTPYNCNICAKDCMYHNTAVPRLCRDCAEEHRLCVRCGADINLAQRKVTK